MGRFQLEQALSNNALHNRDQTELQTTTLSCRLGYLHQKDVLVSFPPCAHRRDSLIDYFELLRQLQLLMVARNSQIDRHGGMDNVDVAKTPAGTTSQIRQPWQELLRRGLFEGLRERVLGMK